MATKKKPKTTVPKKPPSTTNDPVPRAPWQSGRTRAQQTATPKTMWVEFNANHFPIGVTGLASEALEWAKAVQNTGDEGADGYVRKYTLVGAPLRSSSSAKNRSRL